jgi:ribosomal protection tetracycline resistance protein
MSLARKTLNLGILAHVDAGKTTLTERLLFAAGVIDEVGSVDAGTTQTDSLDLERQRGITIRAAVVSFVIGDVTVNLIDTPGHPEFIAEVERVLGVLDGAVLVLSAVAGVQPQTRILMRALQRLRIPALMYVNKIDLVGARYGEVLSAVSGRLAVPIVAMGTVERLATPAAQFRPWRSSDASFQATLTDVLAERDDAILAAYVNDGKVPHRRLRKELVAQTSRASVHPVFFGSAITGAGIEPLMEGIAELLPAAASDADGPVAGTVFKIERGVRHEKIAYVRMFSGAIRVRDPVSTGARHEAKVTAINVFDHGGAVERPSIRAGEIGKLWGLRTVQVGDPVGTAQNAAREHHFAPPTLEATVVPSSRDRRARLRVALDELAEQDPLIHVRQDDSRHEISISLYGEVQKEVIQATLLHDYGIDVTFRDTTPICVERPIGTGEAVKLLHARSNPFLATIGMRVEPGPKGSGIEFRLQVDHSFVPVYLYKTVEDFARRMDTYVRQTLREGLFGWQVTDCFVTMHKCRYSVPDGPPRFRGPLSTAADFRKLTPLVVMQALKRAGTVVCEPIVRVRLETPMDAIGEVMAAVARLRATVKTPSLRREFATIETVLPAARTNDLRRQLPGLTGGEGILESSFAGYQPVTGEQPTRRRTTPNPLNLDEYMMHLARRAAPRQAQP